MRELNSSELTFVSGAGDGCSGGSGNDLGGVTNSGRLGADLINIYEGVVQAVSHVFERLANALSS